MKWSTQTASLTSLTRVNEVLIQYYMLMGCSCSYFAVAVHVTEMEDVYPLRE